ncbi:hypothetical protein wTpre_212 [Wolbachia endosymbiont of Trichogramma pretiosum]|nr:hypothetical protein wTpre_212 [Wolbachia endosymbiont of Trichogramma pretiosum]
MQKFCSLLAKEINSTFNNTHSQNVNLLKFGLVNLINKNEKQR